MRELTPSMVEQIVRKDRDAPNPRHQGVKRVYPVDSRGLQEALYLTSDSEPQTAFLNGNTVAYVVDGW